MMKTNTFLRKKEVNLSQNQVTADSEYTTGFFPMSE